MADVGKIIKTAQETVNEVVELVTGKEKKAGFANITLPKVNDTCLYLIVLYVLLFLYKKEVMVVVNKFLK